jgi:hypothetical protein
VSDNLKITAGALGLEKWAVPRIVVDNFTSSIGDGSFGNTPTLPGRLMVDAIESWTNDAPIPAMVLLRVQRPYVNWMVSNPNYVQLRDQWNVNIAPVLTLPAPPDPSTVLKSQVGGSIDMGTNNTGQPLRGAFWQWRDAHITEEMVGPVPPGQTITVWYRRYLWTPPPWSDNANAGAPLHACYARGVRLVMLALPAQDGKFL